MNNTITPFMRDAYYAATGNMVQDPEILKWCQDKENEEITLPAFLDRKKPTTGDQVTPDYYGAKCKCGRKLDPYTIIDAYPNISRSAHQHAVKKLIRAGKGHKPLLQDIDEVIDTLNRWKEQLNES